LSYILILFDVDKVDIGLKDKLWFRFYMW